MASGLGQPVAKGGVLKEPLQLSQLELDTEILPQLCGSRFVPEKAACISATYQIQILRPFDSDHRATKLGRQKKGSFRQFLSRKVHCLEIFKILELRCHKASRGGFLKRTPTSLSVCFFSVFCRAEG